MYEYDFGDGWRHSIVIEAVQPADPAVRYPRCIDGARACPSEDCGGPPGYAELIQVLGEPDHPEHEEMRARVGPDFDPEHFDLAETNQKLWRMR